MIKILIYLTTCLYVVCMWFYGNGYSNKFSIDKRVTKEFD